MSQTLKILPDKEGNPEKGQCPSALNDQDQKYIITFKGEKSLKPDYGLAKKILSQLRVFRDPARMIPTITGIPVETDKALAIKNTANMTIDNIPLNEFMSSLWHTDYAIGCVTLKGVTNNDVDLKQFNSRRFASIMLQKLGGKNIKHPNTNKEQTAPILPQVLNDFFCEVYKYQFWKHHIIGFNPLIKNALQFIKFAIDPDLNANSGFEDLHEEICMIAKKYDEQYDKLCDAAFDEQVEFSTKVIWNPGNLFCGPGGYKNVKEWEKKYVEEFLPAGETKNLILQAHKHLRFLSKALPPGIKSTTTSINDSTTYNSFLGTSKSLEAFHQAKSFLNCWIKLLPKKNAEYKFNHLTIFRPVMNGKKVIKFDLITHL